MKLLQAYVLLLALSFVTGCAGLLEKREPLRVTLANLQVLDMQLFEQRYLVTLRIQNPNRTELPIEGLSFELSVNDKAFAHGVSAEPVTVSAFSEALMDVTVVSSLFSIIDQLRTLEGQRGKPLSYGLEGKVSLANSLMSIPFEQIGEFGGGYKQKGEPVR